MVEPRSETLRNFYGEPHPSYLAGLVGSGIQASRTPALHEREGAELGLRYIYKLVDLEALALDINALHEILTAAERLGFIGLNITHPCKQAVIPLLDELSSDAEAIGAVNTVVMKDGQWIGHNTDWWGFAQSFRRELPDVTRDRVVLLGAGGAGSAVAHALLTFGTGEVVIIDRIEERAQTLVKALRQRFGDTRAIVIENASEAVVAADGIVNATPVGMAKYPGTPLPADMLRPDQWVAEIVYFPIETELLNTARARGCRTMGGGGMAVWQAVGAFRLFTGHEPNAERMMRHFKEL